MRDHRPTLAKQWLETSSFNRLSQRVSEIQAINQALETILPASFRVHCNVANLSNNFLMLQVANASLKTKLNYERMEILSKLRAQGFAHLVGIDIKVNPELYKVQSNNDVVKLKKVLTPQAAEAILSIAEHVSPQLQKSLQRLAKLAKHE